MSKAYVGVIDGTSMRYFVPATQRSRWRNRGGRFLRQATEAEWELMVEAERMAHITPVHRVEALAAEKKERRAQQVREALEAKRSADSEPAVKKKASRRKRTAST